MAFNMRQELRMSQQLVMTPQLQQAIKLLQLSRIELQDLVRSELLENPLLDDTQEMGSSNEEPVSSIEMQDGLDNQRDGGDDLRQAAESTAKEVKVTTRATTRSIGKRTSTTTATPRRRVPACASRTKTCPRSKPLRRAPRRWPST